jgi:excisionase family DNA binding protein
MLNSHDTDDASHYEQRLFTTEEVAEFLGVSSRTVLMLPIRQYKLGTRTIRYRLEDVYNFLGIDNPNA